jgi:predicted AAA+ superfamily ATPase
LNHGSLPAILDSSDYIDDLKAYVGTYLREEIQAEGLTRSVPNFSRFLDVAGLMNGEQINFTSVASDSGLAPSTVREHFGILEDTLVGHQLPAFQRTVKRKPVATAKFYFFDVGVANALRRVRVVEEGSDAYGRALEHLVFLELRSFLDYHRLEDGLAFWRSRSKLEVDFVVSDRVAIEVKGSARVSARDYRGISALGEELALARRIVVCREPLRRREADVEVLPVAEFLRDLWEGRILR